MRHRFWPAAALCVVAFLPVPSRAAEEAPSVFLRVRSIDSLMEDVKYLAAAVGQAEAGKQIDGFLKSMVGDKGLEGIDTKRSIGFYGTVGPNGVDSSGVLMVPVADEKAFVSLLDRLNLQVQKPDGGLYTFTPPNSPTEAYFRFANKYAYVTALNKSTIDKASLLDPATVLPEKLPAAISLTVRIDRIPDAIKQLFLGQMELRIADQAEKKQPGETELQQKFRAAVLKDLSRRVTQVLKEGQALTVQADLDRKTGDMRLDMALTGKSGSKLATEIADLATTKNLFTGAIGGDSAMNLLFHLTLPAEVQKALGPVWDEAVKQAVEREKDEAKKTRDQKFLAVLAPTIKAGELDLVATRGPGADDRYAMVAGLKVRDGIAIEKAFREMAKELKEEEQAKIKFDVDKVGTVQIHAFEVKKDIDDKAKQLFGEHPLYVAVRSDALLFGFGEGGLAALKEAIAAKPQEGPQMQVEMSIKRIAVAMERGNADLGKAISEAFGSAKDNDRVRLVVEGGKSLQARFTLKAPVLKFFVLVGQKKNADNNE